MRNSVKLSLAGSVAGILVAIAALPGMAHADEAKPDAAATTADAAPAEIVVTATRQTEKARDVPIAVTSISGDKLDVLNSSGLDIRFLSSRTPSLQIESSFGRTYPRFYIRGLGNTDYDPNAAQPVSVVYDGISLENPMLKSFPVFDLADVEVLRGPQGTLFGRNTPAGVVKLDSAKPTDTFGGYGSLEWGTYNTLNGEGALNVPLGDGFSSRFSVIAQHRENWVTNTNYGAPGSVAPQNLEGYTDIAGRAQISYVSPDGSFHALWNIHLRGLDGTPRVFRAGIFAQGSNNFVPGFNPAQVSQDGFTSQSMSQWGTNLHLDKHVDGLGTFYSITGFEHARVESTGDIDGGSSYANFFPATGLGVGLFTDNTGGVTRPDEFSQELRFVSDPFGGVTLQGGAYFFDQKLTYSEYDYQPAVYNATNPLTNTYTVGYTTRYASLDQDIEHNDRNSNIGIYASGEYKSGPWSLRAGVRYSHDRKRDTVWGYSASLSAAYQTADVITTPYGTPGYVLAPQTASISSGFATWDASATYAITPKINFYTRLATGYLGPAVQDRVTFGSIQNTAGKQTTLSAEAGFKGSVLEGKVNFAVDGYWSRTNDMTLTEVGGVGNSAALVTVPRVYGSGAEAEIDMRPFHGLTLSASGSYNYTLMRAPGLGIPTCGSGACTVTDPVNAAGLAVIDGNPLPQAPRYVANINAHYEMPLANGGSAFFNTDWAYRSSINYFLYTAAEFTGRSLTEGGLKVGYRTPNGWELAFFGRNVLNQIRAISAIDFNNLTGMINDPRIWGGSVRKTF